MYTYYGFFELCSQVLEFVNDKLTNPGEHSIAQVFSIYIYICVSYLQLSVSSCKLYQYEALVHCHYAKEVLVDFFHQATFPNFHALCGKRKLCSVLFYESHWAHSIGP